MDIMDIAMAKAIAGGGLPVVKLTTTIANGATLTSEESALLDMAFDELMTNGKQTALRINRLDLGTMLIDSFFCVPMSGLAPETGMMQYAISFGSFVVSIYTLLMGDGLWHVAMQNI